MPRYKRKPHEFRYTKCSVDGCDKNAHTDAHGSSGWCNGHYQRWYRHGNPLAGRTPEYESISWLQSNVGYSSDECLTWPYGKKSDGYGIVWFKGRRTNASRAMCELAHGLPPSPEHEAAHSCGKGHEGCVNPNHLSWKTKEQNEADKIKHDTHMRGERHPLAKLTNDEVSEIHIRANSGEKQNDLAKEFGISRSYVSQIKTKSRNVRPYQLGTVPQFPTTKERKVAREV